MGIDRGALSRIDRKLLAGLDTDEHWQMVRVPASEAIWSAWKRYCSGIGLSMGRGLSMLIQRELEAVIGEELDVDLASGIESKLRSREEAVDDYERRMRDRERSIQQREHLLSITHSFTSRSHASKVERNDRCPCGSGLKYKRCHGSA